MRLLNHQVPIELKVRSEESPLRKLVSLYFAYTWAASRRFSPTDKQRSSGGRNLPAAHRVAAYLVRS